ncbi:MAG: hypothetical protein AB7E77_05160 [Desulfobulbus sp.]
MALYHPLLLPGKIPCFWGHGKIIEILKPDSRCDALTEDCAGVQVNNRQTRKNSNMAERMEHPNGLGQDTKHLACNPLREGQRWITVEKIAFLPLFH